MLAQPVATQSARVTERNERGTSSVDVTMPGATPGSASPSPSAVAFGHVEERTKHAHSGAMLALLAGVGATSAALGAVLLRKRLLR